MVGRELFVVLQQMGKLFGFAQQRFDDVERCLEFHVGNPLAAQCTQAAVANEPAYFIKTDFLFEVLRIGHCL